MSNEPDDKPHAADPPELSALVIDRDAEVPIGVQLAWALRARIGEGQLMAGQRLPGLRDLADAVGVNVNTVRTVYQRLEQEGLIESQQGSGTFVTAIAHTRSPAGAIAAGAAREALETGVDPREVAAALYVSAAPRELTRDVGAHARRALRAQIAALERTLTEMEGAYPGLVSAPAGGSGGFGPALLSAEELERVRARLVRRLAGMQQAIDSQLATPPADEPGVQEASEAQPTPSASRPKRSGARARGTTRAAPAGT